MQTATHLTALEAALGAFRSDATKLTEWGFHLAEVLAAGGRLLACGNGDLPPHVARYPTTRPIAEARRRWQRKDRMRSEPCW